MTADSNYLATLNLEQMGIIRAFDNLLTSGQQLVWELVNIMPDYTYEFYILKQDGSRVTYTNGGIEYGRFKFTTKQVRSNV